VKLVTAFGLVIAIASTLAYGVMTISGSSTVKIVVSGLQDNQQVEVYLVQPVSGGGYSNETSLGTATNGVTMTFSIANLPGYLTTSLINFGNSTRLVPSDRFQRVNASGETLTFSYVKQYEVVVAGGWSGTIPWEGGNISVAGEVNGPGWINSGSVSPIQAIPDPGWMFVYMNISSLIPSSTAPQISLINQTNFSFTQPVIIFVKFVPKFFLLNTNATRGAVNVLNLAPGQRVTLLNLSGQAIASDIVSSPSLYASLNISIVQQPFSGRFVVTLSDGKTVVYTSPVIANIMSQDTFEF
jgi:hypothetical protein